MSGSHRGENQFQKGIKILNVLTEWLKPPGNCRVGGREREKLSGRQTAGGSTDSKPRRAVGKTCFRLSEFLNMRNLQRGGSVHSTRKILFKDWRETMSPETGRQRHVSDI